MNKLKILILFCALLASASAVAATRTVITNDFEHVYDWSTPEIWSDNTPPGPGDSAATIKSYNQTTRLRIGPSDIAHTTNLVSVYVSSSGNSDCATSIVTVAEGSLFTATHRFDIRPGWDAFNYCLSQFIIDGGVVSNKLSEYEGLRIGTATSGKMSRYELIQNGGVAYFSVGIASVGNNGVVKLLGGRFDMAGSFNFNGSQSTFIVDGGDYHGPFSTAGKFQLTRGCIWGTTVDSPTIGVIKNGVYEPSTDVAFIGGGVVSNYYPRFENGSLLMTNGLIRSSVIQLQPAAGKEAHFLMTGGAITNGTAIRVSNSGKVRVFQAGGYVDATGYQSLSFNGTGDYRYTITNGTLKAGSIYVFNDLFCTNATFCLRGTPSVSITKNSYSVTYSNRVHFAFEIDGRCLAPISASPTTNNVYGTRVLPAPIDIASWHTLQPYGGFQLTTTNAFALFRNLKDEGFRQLDPVARLPNAELWENGDLENDAEGHSMFGSTLKESAKISVTRNAGWSQANGVPFGWFALPRLSGRTRSAKVLLGITAKGTNTLEGIVSNLRLGGYEVVVAESISETVGTAEITLPLDRACSKRGEMRNILFDFTSYGTAYDVYEGKVTTNAVVTSAALNIKGTGLMLLCR